MTLPLLVKDRVRSRAGFRCEYCQVTLWRQGDRQPTSEIDHIISRKVGAEFLHSEANLALACGACNRNKGSVIRAIDPNTGLLIDLFNPRTQRHSDHFVRHQGKLVGSTACGRATAVLVFRNTDTLVPGDSTYPFAAQVEDESFHGLLDVAHGYSLANRFQECERLVRDIDHLLAQLDPARLRQLKTVSFARTYIAARISTLRVQVGRAAGGMNDLVTARRLLLKELAAPGVPAAHRAELFRLLATVHQQAATLCAVRGDVSGARHQQALARWAQARNMHTLSSTLLDPRLRWLAMSVKHQPLTSTPHYHADDVAPALLEAGEGAVGPLNSLIDIELTCERPSRHAEALLIGADRHLERGGYGDNRDYIAPTIVRRRWWMLKAWLGEPVDVGLLARELREWRRVELHNEVRELQLGMMKVARARPASVAGVVLEELRGHFTDG